LQASSTTPAQKQVLQFVKNRQMHNGSFVEDADRRSQMQDQINDYKSKLSILSSFFAGATTMDMKSPSKLYEVPRFVFFYCFFNKNFV